MSIELKVGEWYETRDGGLVRAIYDTREHPLRESLDYVLVINSRGTCTDYPRDGNIHSWESWGDIIRHLPDCTGWDWVDHTPGWRDATPEDALHKPHFACRIKDAPDARWIGGNHTLIEYVGDGDSRGPWFVRWSGRDDSFVRSYTLCQVYDPGEGK